MKAAREIAKLRERLAEAEETLRAIRSGEVDAVVVAGKQGPQVFTLEGADRAYRTLIETMNEGALTLTRQGVILYANQCFARMVKRPLEQVLGSSFQRFLSTADQTALRALLKRATRSGTKTQMFLRADNGSQLPVHFSIRPLAKTSSKSAAIGVVVTNMTETRRNEEMLRALTHRLVQAQETERGRVALELHDNITQLLCAILVRSQALADSLSTRDRQSKSEAILLRELLGQVAVEVERISYHLRPSVLEHLGLPVVLRTTATEFVKRTGVRVKLLCRELTERPPLEIEMTIFRILQEALKNVEKHARARHVTVCLRQQRDFIQLAIHDDGIGFNPDRRPANRRGKNGLGLLSMRERATSVGGDFKIKSARGAGTKIEVLIPLPSGTTTANGADL